MGSRLSANNVKDCADEKPGITELLEWHTHLDNIQLSHHATL